MLGSGRRKGLPRNLSGFHGESELLFGRSGDKAEALEIARTELGERCRK